MRHFFRSVRFGIAGLLHVTRTEANMRWHLLAAVVVIVASGVFQISAVEWSLVFLCIGAMLALESLNTGIERLAERVCSQQDPLIGQAKDASAGAVLIMSIAAAAIGVIVFVPKVWALFE